MKLKKVRNALLVVLTLALVSATTVAITWAYVNQGLGTKDNKFTNSDKINIDITEPNWTGSIPDNQKYTPVEGYTPGDVVTVATGENGEELAQGYYPGKQIPKDPRITNISTASGDGTKEYIGAKLVYQVKLPTGENGAIETKTYPTYADFANNIAKVRYIDTANSNTVTDGYNPNWAQFDDRDLYFKNVVDQKGQTLTLFDYVTIIPSTASDDLSTVAASSNGIYTKGAQYSIKYFDGTTAKRIVVDQLPEFNILITGYAVQAQPFATTDITGTTGTDASKADAKEARNALRSLMGLTLES